VGENEDCGAERCGYMISVMWKRLIWLFAVAAAMMPAQVPADAPAFTRDEVSIYRDFLLHYPEQISNIIGMQDTTVAFAMLDKHTADWVPANLKIPAYSGPRLPPEIMALTEEKAVTARIAAKGKLIDPAKRVSGVGPDGYVNTHLTLSEIAFDPEHKQAVFIFSASCGCLGGQGGLVFYLRKHGRWKRDGISLLWQG
jgi:hypothetical protein